MSEKNESEKENAGKWRKMEENGGKWRQKNHKKNEKGRVRTKEKNCKRIRHPVFPRGLPPQY